VSSSTRTFFTRIWRRLVGQEATQLLIGGLSKLGDVDLLLCAYRQMGILKYENFDTSGERHLIQKVLKQQLRDASPTFFDVGANRGAYSIALRSQFPDAKLFAFEPNPQTFKLLCSRLQSSNDHCYRFALGDRVASRTIYTYQNQPDSSHSSMFKDVFISIHNATDVLSYEIPMVTLDAFCEARQIERIDFLKIDTEGYELNVLRGAERLLKERRIKMIQFEFNSMLVSARVFLRDFYSLLNQFDIYRIDTERLIPLPHYDARNEIFQFQNFFASERR
jgi:FkbM family methyltransferase